MSYIKVKKNFIFKGLELGSYLRSLIFIEVHKISQNILTFKFLNFSMFDNTINDFSCTSVPILPPNQVFVYLFLFLGLGAKQGGVKRLLLADSDMGC